MPIAPEKSVHLVLARDWMERIPVTTAVGSLKFTMINDRDSLHRRNQRLRSASASGWMANPKFKICCTIVVY